MEGVFKKIKRYFFIETIIPFFFFTILESKLGINKNQIWLTESESFKCKFLGDKCHLKSVCVFLPATVFFVSSIKALQSFIQQEVYREVSIHIMGWREVGDEACWDSQTAQHCEGNTHQTGTIHSFVPTYSPFLLSFPFNNLARQTVSSLTQMQLHIYRTDTGLTLLISLSVRKQSVFPKMLS